MRDTRSLLAAGGAERSGVESPSPNERFGHSVQVKLPLISPVRFSFYNQKVPH